MGEEGKRKRRRFEDPPPDYKPEEVTQKAEGESEKPETAKVETGTQETAKQETAKTETAKTETAKQETGKTETWSEYGKLSKAQIAAGITDARINPWTMRPYSDRYWTLLSQRSKLPAFEARKEFLKTVKKNQVVVLVGETGSGKTTQCAQFLLDAGYNKGKCIACTQPRRVAAESVARRVAEEMDVPLGQQVGYRVRFDDVTTTGVTVLKYCTDGTLLREAQTNPSLENYSVIMLDEAHERTLDTDILFGLLKEIMKARKTLKVIVMSATLDAGKFQTYFNAPIIHVPGRVHPVEILYTPKPEADYFEAALRTVLQIHATEEAGDILMFLTGEEEIDQMKKSLERDSASMRQKCGELMVVPLYSSLPPAQQQRIFDPAPGPSFPGGPAGRKVVVSTNVAETSITIDGIVYVVDPGFSKQKVYNPRSRVESLLVSPISKASAKQRAGRAGRTQPGKCFRLYTELSFQKDLTEQTYPEILRSNLGSVVLTLLKLGVEDLVHFDFMEPPAPETLMRALEQLNYLNALSDEGSLTPEGELMAEFPLDPSLAKMLVESATHQCTADMLTLTALLSVPPVFVRQRDTAKEADAAKAQFVDELGDHLTMLRVYDAYKQNAGREAEFCWENYLQARCLASADRIREQLTRIYGKLGLESKNASTTNDRVRRAAARKGVCAAFFMQVAHCPQKGSVYFTVPDNQAVALHPSCVIGHYAEWVVYHEFVMTTKNYIRTVTEIDASWLQEVCPKYWNLTRLPMCSAKKRLMQLAR